MLARMRGRPLLLLVICGCGGGGSIPLPEATVISTRTDAEVCDRFTGDREVEPGDVWTAGGDACDPGTLSDAARAETLERIALYRYLVDLPPVTEDLAQRDDDQACAVMMDQNDALDHDPPMSWDCYAAGGRDGAATSNLAIGTSSPAGAIDLFMRDEGVDSLGHRRWIINFDLGAVGIGFAGNATCLGVFDDSGSTARTWVAYPAPGPAPIETANGVWSFHSATSLERADVTVHSLSDERALGVDVDELGGGYGAEAISITPRGWTPTAGETYRVGVTVPGADAIVYDVRVVACGG